MMPRCVGRSAPLLVFLIFVPGRDAEIEFSFLLLSIVKTTVYGTPPAYTLTGIPSACAHVPDKDDK
jgi:hypothetical protein